MQILRALESIGLTREHLTGINNDEIIRIEKKLTAESRLNEELTKNDVSRIIKLLKDYPDVLHWLCQYQCLYGILVGVDAEEIDTVRRHPAAEAERIRQVIAAYFYDDVLTYINLNFSGNAPNWNNLRVLLHYKALLPINILNVVFQRLQNKIDFGLNELKKHTGQSEFNNNCRFLADKVFFMLLSDVDLKYFERYVYATATYLKQNRKNFKAQLLQDMVIAMRYFNADDLKLDYFLRTITGNAVYYSTRSRSPWAPYVGVLFFLISLLRFCANVGNSSYVNNNRDVSYNSQSQLYQKIAEEPNPMDSAKSKMGRFVEARYFSLNYPLNSWREPIVKPAKYANPFTNDVFQFNNIGTRHNLNSLNIFNNTYNECVVIAYYRETYDIYVRKYTSVEDGYPPFMYAIYVPPGDSIKIDFKMSLLRFYMGRSLRGFNTYRNKSYPDSSDVKFAKFTPLDSLLFSRPFVFNGEKLKTQSIVISQPSADVYKLQWQGSGNLYPFKWQGPNYRTDQMDSATNKKPLFLYVPATKNTGDNVIPDFDTFLN
ncbi:hypothetical protein KXD93_18635 [Mucilaginibacter sp. BJC16-A38]|uniref:hypothetical protein n=1 Tax=Mucilaginibacter phenanthrenivorans TaxID=1234842 RepID=UPI0021587841|nr:hypothetical protein [Mucilaginibacter phenanthrenivorans]MCR8559680.1 hypothetical protein [Mucilaginibacter phenanthrenivorans]